MIGHLLIAQPITAVVLEKAAIFECSLTGHRAGNVKWILLDFSFTLLKKEKEKRNAENS